jgi:hypothetical protein
VLEPVDPTRVSLQVREHSIGLGANERAGVDVLSHE